MGFFSRLTFLGRFIIIGCIMGAVGYTLYYFGFNDWAAEWAKQHNVEVGTAGQLQQPQEEVIENAKPVEAPANK